MKTTRLIVTLAATFCVCPALAHARMPNAAGASIGPPNGARGPILNPTSGTETSSGVIAGTSADTSSAVNLYPGLAVRNNDGKKVGSIATVQDDANGRRTVTIKVGPGDLTVDLGNLSMRNGSVVINLSEAQISEMLRKS